MPSTQELGKHVEWTFPAKLVKVVDADTVDFLLDELGFGLCIKVRVRLLGIDAPETYGVPHDSDEYKRGMKSKQYVEAELENAQRIEITTTKKRKGKYGRYLAIVKYLDKDGQSRNLNLDLVDKRLAVERDY